MSLRLCSAGFVALLVLCFLGWYDGWGRGPLTAEEVDRMLGQLGPDAEGVEFLDRLRAMGLADDGEEFFMLNLNRYPSADGSTPADPPAAYNEYGRGVIGMLLLRASHPAYTGAIRRQLLIGDEVETYWDEVLLVRYRSRRDFLSMVTSDAYQEIARTRAGGVDYAEVTPTRPQINLLTPRLVVFGVLLLLALVIDGLLRRRGRSG